MRYLITGGAGFIGSHLSDRLIDLGPEVFVIDDLSTGAMDNIRHLKGHERFHYHIDTIANAGPLLLELGLRHSSHATDEYPTKPKPQ